MSELLPNDVIGCGLDVMVSTAKVLVDHGADQDTCLAASMVAFGDAGFTNTELQQLLSVAIERLARHEVSE